MAGFKPTIYLRISLSIMTGCAAVSPLCFAEQQPSDFFHKHPPTVESNYSYFVDSYKTRASSWQELGTLPLTQYLNWTTSYTRSKYAQPDITSIFENKYLTGLQYAKDDQAWEARVGTRDFSRHNPSSVYFLSGTSPVWFLKSVTLTHAYDYWETAKAIDEKIKAYVTSVAVCQLIPDRWIVTSLYQHHQFSDTNERNYIQEAIFYRITLKSPELRVGYGYVYGSTKVPSPLYWSPDNLRTHQAQLMLVGQLWGSRLSYNLAYALGYAMENQQKNRITHSGSGDIIYKLHKGWEFFVRLEVSSEPTYKSTLTQAGFRYRF